MEQDTKQEGTLEGREPQGPPIKGIQGEGWKVTDEEIDLVLKKLEEGWGF